MVHTTTSSRLGVVIAEALSEADITLRQASDRTGIPRTTLSRRQLTGGFTVEELEALAGLLGTTVVALIAKAEQVAA